MTQDEERVLIIFLSVVAAFLGLLIVSQKATSHREQFFKKDQLLLEEQINSK
jgi:hypothetical protein